MTVTAALRDSRAARARLEGIYGHVPPVVYFVQREDGGPVKIGRALRLAEVLADPRASLYNGGIETVTVRAVVPGRQALMHWFHRRHRERQSAGEWFDDAESVVADAREFGGAHADWFSVGGDLGRAARMTLRDADPFLADFERLYRNGMNYARLEALTGLSNRQVRSTVERMRALGFDVPHRQPYRRRVMKL